MKFLIEGNKRKRKILLAGLLLAQTFADIALYALASDPPAQYHLEASFQKDTGFKMILDKH